MTLQNKKILLGVTGSIAAYKACDLVQRLKEKGASVRVVMTHSATRIVHPNAFAALTSAPVLVDAWDGVAQGAMPHIEAARWADLFLIAPCTAHTLAEISQGLTGSAVSPAMNTVMLDAAPVRENLDRLAARGVHVLPTLNGNLACGEVGAGKLTTPEELAAYAELILTFAGKVPDFSGKRVLISGGHTEEPLDGVRFLSNRSSGKTAVAIARALRLAGADVHLVLGRAEEPEPNGIQLTRVRTSAEFRDALLAAQPSANAVIMAAAIADFVPQAQSALEKWKASRDMKSLALTPTPNILEEMGARKSKGQVLVGFALETGAARARALEKMHARHCDLMVVNTPLGRAGAGFGENVVEAAILSPSDGSDDADLPLLGKDELAVDLVRRVAAVLSIESNAGSALSSTKRSTNGSAR
jgi:phosphopantothenoylcysteine decarboxylase/phosphopantothenate--cysteine ligase